MPRLVAPGAWPDAASGPIAATERSVYRSVRKEIGSATPGVNRISAKSRSKSNAKPEA